MITLHIQSIDQQGQQRNFHCKVNRLEEALNALSAIALSDNHLLEAYIVENGHCTYLPLQAFDGEDLGKAVLELQAQWEKILAPGTPPAKSPSNLTPHERILIWVEQYETVLMGYDRDIARLETLMVQAHEQLKEGSSKDSLLRHYHTLATQQHRLRANAQARQHKYIKKLASLKLNCLE
ncbi:hypothetical protein [Spirosoma sp.]|uniref:hypothetical protein n=1 Tax=Spirosoma sp. TaxID=1899569 RepID=UPI003B3BBCA3